MRILGANLTILTLLAVALAGTPARAAATECGDLPGLRAGLNRLITEQGLAGAAVEVDNPRCGRWTASAGVADRRIGRPMPVDERFRIGSITKTFTAVAVLQLAAEGQVSLDASVDSYLPGLVQGAYDGRRMSVRDLLRHTSGLPDHADLPEGEQWRYRTFRPAELVRLALAMPRPERTWHYSTTNYALAGMIVERVTGRPLEAEVERRVLRPLGLSGTYWPGDSPAIRGAHPRSYTLVEQNGTPIRIDGTNWNMSYGWAGGALISTLPDLNRFFDALLDGRLLPAPWTAELTRTIPADEERLGAGARYGLGVMSLPMSCGGHWIGHGGTSPGGFRAWTAVNPNGRRVSFVLNEVPATEQAELDFRAVVDTALCEENR
ncbi:serine hydrolase domain-containing protein [Actinocorallia sp. B10E7]|uniref:serine hydrolase domain-containing protein n=1 Tax=Actinocorallia sp. B10E7 TaxID=3153558 RepID=UPI00325F6E72